jgi:hypothetical protein
MNDTFKKKIAGFFLAIIRVSMTFGVLRGRFELRSDGIVLIFFFSFCQDDISGRSVGSDRVIIILLFFI